MSKLSTDIACKFGGTSLAAAAQIRQVAAILQANPARRFVVVSAPGKRSSTDSKITDLLYACHDAVKSGENPLSTFKVIRARFEEIGRELGTPGAAHWIDEVEQALLKGATRDFMASRGEYLSGRIIAEFLGARFIDAADCIRFTKDGRLDPQTYPLAEKVLSGDGRFIIPGFYGAQPNGSIKTFSRGGSDVSGAIVARAVNAAVYENWTDVNGVLMADPRVVENPRPIQEITYTELRELAYMGASVLHDQAVFPVREAQIPINIRNTNDPEHPGTLIIRHRPEGDLPIIGIAGRQNFSTIYVDKLLMNEEHGFGRRLLEILEKHGISYEHTPSGIDSMSVIIEQSALLGKEADVIREIETTLRPDKVEVIHGLALIATVGQGMNQRIGVAGKLLTALAEAKVNVRMINQGASETNIIVGVDNNDYQAAVRAIYHAFVG